MKSEFPPLRMVVGPGKLTPADPFTQERLDSFRNGTVMTLKPAADQTWKRRKYFAILALVVKNCDTKFRNVDQANNELKRLLGIVEEGRTVSGTQVIYPRSLNDLEEPEFEDFYEGAMLLLQRMTGVDPETLSKEAADPGKDQEPSTPTSSGVDEGSGAGNRPNLPSREPAPLPRSNAPSPLKAEAVAKIMHYATDENVAADVRLVGLIRLEEAWLDQLPDDEPFLRKCCEMAGGVINGSMKEAEARRYLNALAAGKTREKGNGSPDA
ncbi:hypothetical protein ELH77_18965 [Rhizobium ruizarguesonis]|uniref:hypothetical protein n=1 Tax=Rhizobium ruizarguesonis TaxID=2081791 RepID=UPI001030A363|nr:hypothetical protein [Rhizobium ruizarguesonis]TAZ20688.1 hypothetical protein ELH77_18965 [Rhizobium ruizarguesonis]